MMWQYWGIQADVYRFRGIVRWELWWNNPNFAAAFLAGLLPLLLALQRAPSRLVRIAAWVAEAGLWYALCATFSRGGLLGALIALGVVLVGRWWFGGERIDRGFFTVLGARFAVVAGCALAVGMGGRLSPEFAERDLSVLHRIDIWSAAPALVQQAGWTGWGAGRSGFAFQNFFQAPESSVPYTGLINGAVQFPVEFGIVGLSALTALLVAGGAGLLGLVRDPQRPQGRHWGLAGLATLAAFFTCNLFTTVWADPSLLLTPVMALCLGWVFFFGGVRTHRTWLVPAVAGLLPAVAFAVMQLAAPYSRCGAGLELRRDGGDITLRHTTENSSAVRTCRLLWDAELDPGLTGKFARACANAAPADCRVVFAAEPGAGAVHGEAAIEIACGEECAAALRNTRTAAELCLFAPRCRPPAAMGVCPRGVVLLRRGDQPFNGVWRKACEAAGIPCREAATMEEVPAQLAALL